MFNFGFGQSSLNEQFKKIISERGETQNPNDTYIKNHEIWAEYFKIFKKDEIIPVVHLGIKKEKDCPFD